MNDILRRLEGRERDPRGFTEWGWYHIFKALLEGRDRYFGTLEDAARRIFGRYKEGAVKAEMRKGYAHLAAELAANPRLPERTERLLAFGKALRLLSEPGAGKEKRRSR